MDSVPHPYEENTQMKVQVSLVAGVLSAIGATACCFGPLLLVVLGFGGQGPLECKGWHPSSRCSPA